jgi:RNA polymerase sigma-32 factor
MAHLDTGEVQSANKKFIKKAMKFPMLESEHEHDLAKRWATNRDEAALHELTQSHLRLVIAMASKLKNYGLSVADLVQEGNIGLMQAAERFDPDRGVRFSTYAGWWIRASMQDFILRNWSIVRTGTTAAQKSLFFNLRRLRAKIRDSGPHMTQSSRDYVARELGVRAEDVIQMEGRLSGGDSSLNAQIGNGEDGQTTEWQDLLVCDRSLPDEAVANRLDRQKHQTLLQDLMDQLSARERVILQARQMSETSRTLEDLGKELRLSKERVRQIEHEALKKLRHMLVSREDGAFLKQQYQSGLSS